MVQSPLSMCFPFPSSPLSSKLTFRLESSWQQSLLLLLRIKHAYDMLQFCAAGPLLLFHLTFAARVLRSNLPNMWSTVECG
jgi:hypothetical protein